MIRIIGNRGIYVKGVNQDAEMKDNKNQVEPSNLLGCPFELAEHIPSDNHHNLAMYDDLMIICELNLWSWVIYFVLIWVVWCLMAHCNNQTAPTQGDNKIAHHHHLATDDAFHFRSMESNKVAQI